MLCWYKGRHDDGFEFRTYDIRDGKGAYNKYEIPNEVGKAQGMAKTEVAVTTMWEMRPLEFMLVCISNRPATEEGPANNNYIADVKTKTIREAKFNLGKYQDLHLDQHYMGNTCMFRTFDFEQGKALSTPVHYVNNETEEIVASENWECSYLHKYEFPGYDGNMIVEGMYENADVEEVTIMSKKVMDPREISVHFLCELIPKVDEDLLYDVTKLIDYK